VVFPGVVLTFFIILIINTFRLGNTQIEAIYKLVNNPFTARLDGAAELMFCLQRREP
jgi:hypothetical protein